MVSKVDVAVIAALAAGCALWIERGHNIIIDAPTESELAAAAAAAACPESDNVPYSVRCLDFLGGFAASGMRRPAAEPPNGAVPAPHAEVPPQAGPAPCPDRDDMPYSASCLAFLQGATEAGMRWRVRAPGMPAPDYAPKPVAAATSGQSGRNGTGAAVELTPAAR
jgi:hypothetical protein